MTTKLKSSTACLRKISKPVISTDVMGNRNVEVRAVGAWVQAEVQPMEQEALLAAAEEESRLCQIQIEKQARLKHFQQEVRKRVNCLDKLKKQAMLETNYKATEHERNIVCQSAFSSRDWAKKDTSLVRPNTAMSVDKSSKTCKGDHYVPAVLDNQAFSDQTNQVHQHVHHAKKSLVSRQVITEKFLADDLPGGVWRISKTRDHPSSRCTVDGDEFNILDEQLIDKVKVANNNVYPEECSLEPVNNNLIDDKQKTVQFDERSIKAHEQTSKQFRPHSARNSQEKDIQRNMPLLRVPNIYEGVQTEEEKRRARSQQAMYRRLFMDLEREQVKENLRTQKHRKRIQKLKKEKEEERIKEEQMSHQMIEPRDPVTGETSQEAIEREDQEKRFIFRTIRENEIKAKRSREIERYIEAIRHQLMIKVRQKKLELPPLCCCGETIWDTNPETCANNCIFYKNPKEYGRALQAMLDSSDLQIL